MRTQCPACNGGRLGDGEWCGECGGSGYVTLRPPKTYGKCTDCNGTGKVVWHEGESAQRCSSCEGVGYTYIYDDGTLEAPFYKPQQWEIKRAKARERRKAEEAQRGKDNAGDD